MPKTWRRCATVVCWIAGQASVGGRAGSSSRRSPAASGWSGTGMPSSSADGEQSAVRRADLAQVAEHQVPGAADQDEPLRAASSRRTPARSGPASTIAVVVPAISRPGCSGPRCPRERADGRRPCRRTCRPGGRPRPGSRRRGRRPSGRPRRSASVSTCRRSRLRSAAAFLPHQRDRVLQVLDVGGRAAAGPNEHLGEVAARVVRRGDDEAPRRQPAVRNERLGAEAGVAVAEDDQRELAAARPARRGPRRSGRSPTRPSGSCVLEELAAASRRRRSVRLRLAARRPAFRAGYQTSTGASPTSASGCVSPTPYGPRSVKLVGPRSRHRRGRGVPGRGRLRSGRRARDEADGQAQRTDERAARRRVVGRSRAAP